MGLARLHGPGDVDIIGRGCTELAPARDIDGPDSKIGKELLTTSYQTRHIL